MLVVMAVVSSSATALAPGAGAASAPAAAPTGHGPVDVLYAGSMTALMEQTLGPAFTRATGDEFTGFAAGSKELANEIKDGVRQGDVFISASPDLNAILEGAANGDHVSWYLNLGQSALVLGYDPKSVFAGKLTRQPWYKVVTEPGFRLGRTDPALDPKGALAVAAVDQTARQEHDPSLASVLDTQDIFPEEALVGRLQTGQLDAGFFYALEARAAGFPTVPLTPSRLSARFTVTILNRAPHQAAAIAFVRYLLGTKGRAELTAAGMTLTTPPALHGTGLPQSLRAAVGLR